MPFERRFPVALMTLAASLAVPSVGLVQKYLGYGGAVAYIVGVCASVLVAYRALDSPLATRLGERGALALLGATFVALIGVFAAVHPAIDYAQGDANEALDYAVRELLAGRYSYGVQTQLGNVIAPLPGAVLLALPFVVLGDSAYQNFFWLALFCLLCRGLLGSWRASLAVLSMILLLSPTIVQSLLLGGDRVASTLFTLLLMVFFIDSVTKRPTAPGRAILAALLLGLCLSSRGNFLFLLLPALPLLLAGAGLRRTAWSLAVTAASFIAVTAPFYLADPNGFTPTHQITKLTQAFPYAREIVLMAAGLLAIALAVRTARLQAPGYRDFFAGAAILQAFLFASAVALFSLQVQDAQSTFVFIKEGYGVHFLFFGVLASVITLWPGSRLIYAPAGVPHRRASPDGPTEPA